MLRSLVTIVFAVLFVLLALPAMGVAALIGLANQQAKDRINTAIVRFYFRVILFLSGVRLTVIGKERVPANRACLFVGNHRSVYDIIIAYSQLPGLAGIVSKKEMKKIPVFSLWMRMIHCLFLDREDPREGLKMIQDGTELLSSGISMYICPEGTRNKGEEDLPLLPFHEGSFRMATKIDAPVVPVAMNNAYAIWERQFPWLRASHVVLEFCDPIETAALSRTEKKQMGAATREIMQEAIRRNQSLL